jgi:hypothetical protein
MAKITLPRNLDPKRNFGHSWAEGNEALKKFMEGLTPENLEALLKEGEARDKDMPPFNPPS